MSLLYVVVASLLIALCQLCMHAKAQEKGKDELLMVVRFFLSALICALFFPLLKRSFAINTLSIVLGVGAGVLQGSLMLYTRKALSLGCSNLAIAFLNSSCVVPPLLMAFLFGHSFHFGYSWLNVLGAVTVCLGFFFAAQEQTGDKQLSIRVLLTAFLFQVLFLLFLQWKALNFKPDLPQSSLLPFQGLQESLWFNSIMFLTCALFQWVQTPAGISLTTKELTLYGILGGLANGFSGVLLLKAIDLANTSLENALLYPLLSIGTVGFCQIWAKWLFKEKLQWRANLCFLLGILLNS